MRIKHRDFMPVIDPSAYVAPTAMVVGNDRVGSGSRMIYGAVLDSDGSRIEVGGIRGPFFGRYPE